MMIRRGSCLASTDRTRGIRAVIGGDCHCGGCDGIAGYEMCLLLRGGGSLENLDKHATDYLQWMRGHGLTE